MDIQWTCNLNQVYTGLEKQLRNAQVRSQSALSHLRKKCLVIIILKTKHLKI